MTENLGETGTEKQTLDLAEDLPDLLVALLTLKIHSHDDRRHLNANFGSSVSYTNVHRRSSIKERQVKNVFFPLRS